MKYLTTIRILIFKLPRLRFHTLTDVVGTLKPHLSASVDEDINVAAGKSQGIHNAKCLMLCHLGDFMSFNKTPARLF